MSYHQQMSSSKCTKLIMVSDDGMGVVGHLGKRLNKELAGEERALLEGSTTKYGPFPHHMTLGPGREQQLLVSESQGRRGGAMGISETQDSLKGRGWQICVCECHTQSMSHERCALRS